MRCDSRFRRFVPSSFPHSRAETEETVEKLTYVTLLSIFGRSQEAKRRLDGVWGPHLPTMPQRYGQAWRRGESRKLVTLVGRKGPTPF